MKKVLLLFVSLLVGFTMLHAQEPLSFEKVIKVDSVSKNDIYSKIKEHFILKYKSTVFFKTDDRETGLLVKKEYFDFYKKGFFYTCYCGKISVLITIQVKDGRFKVQLSDFLHEPNGMCGLGIITTGDLVGGTINGKSFDNPVWKDLQEKAKIIGDNLLFEFENLKLKTDNW